MAHAKQMSMSNLPVNLLLAKADINVQLNLEKQHGIQFFKSQAWQKWMEKVRKTLEFSLAYKKFLPFRHISFGGIVPWRLCY